MTKRFWILGLCLLMACGLHAQTTYRSSGKPKYNSKKKKQQEETFVQKLIVGGGLTLGFGEYTNIGATPVIGYRITDNFSAGIGLGYQYVKINDYFPIRDSLGFTNYEDLKAHLFSASIWARYVFWRNLFGQAEFEHNSITIKDYGFDPGGSGQVIQRTNTQQAPCILLGLGYRQPLGDRSSVNFSLHYDVLQADYSPYGNQVFPRIQFLVGF